MNLIKKQWQLKSGEFQPNEDFIAKLKCDRIWEQGSAFSNAITCCGTDSEVFHSPFLFKDMNLAVKRIMEAITHNERILIHGDYDVDGISATAILLDFFNALGVRCFYHIPNRLEEDYGISSTSIHQILKKKVNLLITVDCGITACKEIDFLRQEGVSVIITDHHIESDLLPNCDALINCILPTEKYPFKRLAGASVALKLVAALCTRLPLRIMQRIKKNASEDELRFFWHKYFDYAAFGTVADVMPLIGENRYIVKQGIIGQKTKPSIFVKAMSKHLKMQKGYFDEHEISFLLAPRINAAGRMGKANIALKAMMSTSMFEAQKYIQELDKYNEQRKNHELAATNLVQDFFLQEDNLEYQNIIVFASEKMHQGVLGILAAKLSQKYYKPAIVLAHAETDKNGRKIFKGSARSYGEINILELLRQAGKNLLLQLGGHYHAAGISISEENIPELKRRINYLSSAPKFSFIRPNLKIDYVIGEEYLTLKNALALEAFGPFGESRPEFIFCSKNLTIKSVKKVRANSRHLQFVFDIGHFKSIDGIAFNAAGLFPCLRQGQKIDIVYNMRVNNFRGQKKLQFFILDMASSFIDYNCPQNKNLYSDMMNKEEQIKYFKSLYLFLKAIPNDSNDLALIEIDELARFHAMLWGFRPNNKISMLCLQIFEEAKLIELKAWSNKPLIKLLNFKEKGKEKLSNTFAYQKLMKELRNLC